MYNKLLYRYIIINNVENAEGALLNFFLEKSDATFFFFFWNS